jgi:hypothetical protein
MGTKVGEGSGIEAVRTQFEDWRNGRARKSPIPEELWSAAINAARQEGVNRTAQQLRLDAGKLKRLLVAADGRGRRAPREPRFVEWIAPAPASTPECLIEFESPTCELCDTNSFDYLTDLQRHAQELAANPASWMPWNYRETIGQAGV